MEPSRQYAGWLISRWEGLASIKPDGLVYPYICPAGYPTQGFGRRVQSMTNPPITRKTAGEWLAEDLGKYENAVLSQIPNLKKFPLTLAAIISFTYNLGEGNLRISTLKKRLLVNDWKGAVLELQRWKYSKGQVLPGLVARRAAEAQLIKIEHGLNN